MFECSFVLVTYGLVLVPEEMQMRGAKLWPRPVLSMSDEPALSRQIIHLKQREQISEKVPSLKKGYESLLIVFFSPPEWFKRGQASFYR